MSQSTVTSSERDQTRDAGHATHVVAEFQVTPNHEGHHQGRHANATDEEITPCSHINVMECDVTKGEIYPELNLIDFNDDSESELVQIFCKQLVKNSKNVKQNQYKDYTNPKDNEYDPSNGSFQESDDSLLNLDDSYVISDDIGGHSFNATSIASAANHTSNTNCELVNSETDTPIKTQQAVECDGAVDTLHQIDTDDKTAALENQLQFGDGITEADSTGTAEGESKNATLQQTLLDSNRSADVNNTFHSVATQCENGFLFCDTSTGTATIISCNIGINTEAKCASLCNATTMTEAIKQLLRDVSTETDRKQHLHAGSNTCSIKSRDASTQVDDVCTDNNTQSTTESKSRTFSDAAIQQNPTEFQNSNEIGISPIPSLENIHMSTETDLSAKQISDLLSQSAGNERAAQTLRQTVATSPIAFVSKTQTTDCEGLLKMANASTETKMADATSAEDKMVQARFDSMMLDAHAQTTGVATVNKECGTVVTQQNSYSQTETDAQSDLLVKNSLEEELSLRHVDLLKAWETIRNLEEMAAEQRQKLDALSAWVHHARAEPNDVNGATKTEAIDDAVPQLQLEQLSTMTSQTPSHASVRSEPEEESAAQEARDQLRREVEKLRLQQESMQYSVAIIDKVTQNAHDSRSPSNIHSHIINQAEQVLGNLGDLGEPAISHPLISWDCVKQSIASELQNEALSRGLPPGGDVSDRSHTASASRDDESCTSSRIDQQTVESINEVRKNKNEINNLVSRPSIEEAKISNEELRKRRLLMLSHVYSGATYYRPTNSNKHDDVSSTTSSAEKIAELDESVELTRMSNKLRETLQNAREAVEAKLATPSPHIHNSHSKPLSSKRQVYPHKRNYTAPGIDNCKSDDEWNSSSIYRWNYGHVVPCGAPSKSDASQSTLRHSYREEFSQTPEEPFFSAQKHSNDRIDVNESRSTQTDLITPRVSKPQKTTVTQIRKPMQFHAELPTKSQTMSLAAEENDVTLTTRTEAQDYAWRDHEDTVTDLVRNGAKESEPGIRQENTGSYIRNLQTWYSSSTMTSSDDVFPTKTVSDKAQRQPHRNKNSALEVDYRYMKPTAKKPESNITNSTSKNNAPHSPPTKQHRKQSATSVASSDIVVTYSGKVLKRKQHLHNLAQERFRYAKHENELPTEKLLENDKYEKQDNVPQYSEQEEHRERKKQRRKKSKEQESDRRERSRSSKRRRDQYRAAPQKDAKPRDKQPENKPSREAEISAILQKYTEEAQRIRGSHPQHVSA